MLRRIFLLVGLAGLMVIPACKSNKYKYTYPPKSYTRHIAPPTTNTARATSASKKYKPVQLAPAPRVTPLPKKRTAVHPVKPAARVTSVPSPKASPPVMKSRAAAASAQEVADDEERAGGYKLRPGDPIIVYLRGIPGVPGGEQQIQDVVDEDGAINLPYINELRVGGNTPTKAENLIRHAYIDQKIYKYITVNVVVPARSYYVRGEVRQPGRFPLMNDVTIIQALAAAGGFTEFANPKKVEILRGTRRIPLNLRDLERHPDRDISVKAGDVIIVNRSFF